MKQETDINQFVEAINGISSVRDYDLKILETAQHYNNLALWAIIISLFVALITIIATIYIFRRQENIIKEQLKISSQQNSIALFDKRYGLISMMEKLTSNLTVIVVNASFISGLSENDKIALIFNNISFVPNESNSIKLSYILEQFKILKYLFILEDEDKVHINEIKKGLRALATNIIDESAKNHSLNLTHKGEIENFKNFLKTDSENSSKNTTLEYKIVYLAKRIVEYKLFEKLQKQLNLIP